MNFDDVDESSDLQEIRLILLGRTGRGKSALGNSICGSEERNIPFESRTSSSSVTQTCKTAYREYDDHKLCVIDTPGLFDTHTSLKETMDILTEAFRCSNPGPHAFLIVLNGRCTHEDQATFDLLIQKFGQYLLNYCIIVLTREDDIRSNDKQSSDDDIIQKYFEEAPASLKDLRERCNYRCILIDNGRPKVEREKKIALLVDMIRKNEEEHGNSYYTQEMFDQAEQFYREMYDNKLDEERRECASDVEKLREEIDRAACERKMKLQQNKSEAEIQRKIANERSDEDHHSTVIGKRDSKSYYIGKFMNKVIDNNPKFTNQQ